MDIRCRFVIFAFCLFSASCELALSCKVDSRPSSDGSKTYLQDFKTDVAWIPLEWNGKPMGWGSGFLVDKDRGAFFTNKHVSNEFNTVGKGSHKLFFNGKVYNTELVKTPPTVDAALIKITDEFDSSEFPESASFSGEKVKVGDRVWVEGFHVHSYSIRKADGESGYNFPVIPIFRDYYRMNTRDLDNEKEVVFEKLEARVTNINKKIEIGGQGSGIVQDMRNIVNLYIEIKTSKDHLFSFGGLSGTVVRNDKGETVGIFTAGPTEESVPVHELEDGSVVSKIVFQTAYITPIGAAEKLKNYLR